MRKQCGSRNCRTAYGFNYLWDESKKVNCVDIEMLQEAKVLFVNSKRCFTLNYLKYHEELMFRGGLPARAAEWAYRTVYGAEDCEVVEYGRNVLYDFRKLHMDALFYFMTLKARGL